jgi:hypothetical protein
VQELSWFQLEEEDAIFPYVSLFLGPNIFTIRLSFKSCGVNGLSLLPSGRGIHHRRVCLDSVTCSPSQKELTQNALMHLGKLPRSLFKSLDMCLFDAMGHCNCSTLTSIECDPLAHVTDGVRNIRPLFAFSGLRSVDLSLREGI